MHFDNWYCRECGWFPEPETWKGSLPTEYVKHDCMPVTAIRTDELDRLKSENARLREALKNLLKDIKRTVDINVDFTIQNTFDAAISTIIKASSLNKAREALKGEE
jgi:hypothetical protein